MSSVGDFESSAVSYLAGGKKVAQVVSTELEERNAWN